MRFHIKHETNYEFTSEVYLEPHFLRFKPKNALHLQLDSFELQIDPIPQGISEATDAEQNFIHLCWFAGYHKRLHITSNLVVSIDDFNPFNFIIYPFENEKYPIAYEEKTRFLLEQSLHADPIEDELIEYGRSVMADSGDKVIDFLMNLTKSIYTNFKLKVREHGAPNMADQTFVSRVGSCRDLSWMQIQLLRHMGFASRFVSGYFYPLVEKPEFELHAWVEVYLPGAGWIGYQPGGPPPGRGP